MFFLTTSIKYLSPNLKIEDPEVQHSYDLKLDILRKKIKLNLMDVTLSSKIFSPFITYILDLLSNAYIQSFIETIISLYISTQICKYCK